MPFLSPFHNIGHNLFNVTYHKDIDGIIDEGILNNLDTIKVYPIRIDLEEDLAKEIANQAMALGYKLEDENRLLTKEEAYQQVSHSASLFKAILQYLSLQDKSEKKSFKLKEQAYYLLMQIKVSVVPFCRF